MAVYAIFTYDITDPDTYKQYSSGAGASFAGRSAKVLAVDPNTRAVEGEGCRKQTVLLEFESEQAFDDWYKSPEYQAVIGKRHAGTSNGQGILAKGL